MLNSPFFISSKALTNALFETSTVIRSYAFKYINHRKHKIMGRSINLKTRNMHCFVFFKSKSDPSNNFNKTTPVTTTRQRGKVFNFKIAKNGNMTNNNNLLILLSDSNTSNIKAAEKTMPMY